MATFHNNRCEAGREHALVVVLFSNGVSLRDDISKELNPTDPRGGWFVRGMTKVRKVIDKELAPGGREPLASIISGLVLIDGTEVTNYNANEAREVLGL